MGVNFGIGGVRGLSASGCNDQWWHSRLFWGRPRRFGRGHVWETPSSAVGVGAARGGGVGVGRPRRHLGVGVGVRVANVGADVDVMVCGVFESAPASASEGALAAISAMALLQASVVMSHRHRRPRWRQCRHWHSRSRRLCSRRRPRRWRLRQIERRRPPRSLMAPAPLS